MLCPANLACFCVQTSGPEYMPTARTRRASVPPLAHIASIFASPAGHVGAEIAGCKLCSFLYTAQKLVGDTGECMHSQPLSDEWSGQGGTRIIAAWLWNIPAQWPPASSSLPPAAPSLVEARSAFHCPTLSKAPLFTILPISPLLPGGFKRQGGPNAATL